MPNIQMSDRHNVTAEIKIKKDEQILVSIRFLGTTKHNTNIGELL
jgi:hypothetical protein